MNSELFWAYLLAITLLTVTPGVDTLLVLRNTGRGGLRDGCVTSAGICSGLFIHATLSALGISVVMMQTAWAFSVLKWAGACYLIWLGIVSLLSALSRGRESLAAGDQVIRNRVSAATSFREGVLSNALNPKTALFYMALLPQFVDPAGDAFRQSLGLAAVHFLLAMVWQCSLAWMMVRFRRLGTGMKLRRTLNALTGGFFVVIGARLAGS